MKLTAHDSPTGCQWILVQSEEEIALLFHALCREFAKALHCSSFTIAMYLDKPQFREELSKIPHGKLLVLMHQTARAAGPAKNSVDPTSIANIQKIQKFFAELESNPEKLAKFIEQLIS